MQMRRRQQGLSLVGFLIVLAIVGFLAYTAMLLVPPYVEYMGVVKSMKTVAGEPTSYDMGVEPIRQRIGTNMDIQYVDQKTVPLSAFTLNAHTLRVVYDKEIPYLFNISLLLHFDHMEKINGRVD